MQLISSLDHPLIKEMVALRKDKRARLEQGLCFLEGSKTIEEVAKKRPLETLLSLTPIELPAKKAFLITERVLVKLSGCLHPEGVVATTALPHQSPLEGMKWILALDRIQDPGNLGSLVRSALGLGWEALFLIEGGCDLFHEKVIRATKGASLLLPYRIGTGKELLSLGIPLFSGALHGAAPESSSSAILFLGQEGSGLSPEWIKESRPLTIPLEGRIDSLNVAVAGALLMAKLKGIL